MVIVNRLYEWNRILRRRRRSSSGQLSTVERGWGGGEAVKKRGRRRRRRRKMGVGGWGEVGDSGGRMSWSAGGRSPMGGRSARWWDQLSSSLPTNTPFFFSPSCQVFPTSWKSPFWSGHKKLSRGNISTFKLLTKYMPYNCCKHCIFSCCWCAFPFSFKWIFIVVVIFVLVIGFAVVVIVGVVGVIVFVFCYCCCCHCYHCFYHCCCYFCCFCRFVVAFLAVWASQGHVSFCFPGCSGDNTCFSTSLIWKEVARLSKKPPHLVEISGCRQILRKPIFRLWQNNARKQPKQIGATAIQLCCCC